MPTRGFTISDTAEIKQAHLGNPTPAVTIVDLPFLVLNAGWDGGLSDDGTYFVNLLTQLGAKSIDHVGISTANHASVCWV